MLTILTQQQTNIIAYTINTKTNRHTISTQKQTNIIAYNINTKTNRLTLLSHKQTDNLSPLNDHTHTIQITQTITNEVPMVYNVLHFARINIYNTLITLTVLAI